MGTLRSSSPDPTGHVVNGVTLGQPIELGGDRDVFAWDDAAYPNGTVAVAGGDAVVAVDESTHPV